MQQRIYVFLNMFNNRKKKKTFSYREFIGRRIKDMVTIASLLTANPLIPAKRPHLPPLTQGSASDKGRGFL